MEYKPFVSPEDLIKVKDVKGKEIKLRVLDKLKKSKRITPFNRNSI